MLEDPIPLPFNALKAFRKAPNTTMEILLFPINFSTRPPFSSVAFGHRLAHLSFLSDLITFINSQRLNKLMSPPMFRERAFFRSPVHTEANRGGFADFYG